MLDFCGAGVEPTALFKLSRNCNNWATSPSLPAGLWLFTSWYFQLAFFQLAIFWIRKAIQHLIRSLVSGREGCGMCLISQSSRLPCPPCADNHCAITGTFLNPLQDLGSGCHLFSVSHGSVIHVALKLSSQAGSGRGGSVGGGWRKCYESTVCGCQVRTGGENVNQQPPTQPSIHLFILI